MVKIVKFHRIYENDEVSPKRISPTEMVKFPQNSEVSPQLWNFPKIAKFQKMVKFQEKYLSKMRNFK